MTPFDYFRTNEILVASENRGIDGVIIQYDKEIEAAGYYKRPALIAIVRNEQG